MSSDAAPRAAGSPNPAPPDTGKADANPPDIGQAATGPPANPPGAVAPSGPQEAPLPGPPDPPRPLDTAIAGRAPRRPRLSRRLRRGAYLLPSLFTIGNILLGFYAIVCGLAANFQRAALVVFVAAITDSLDGAVARLTGTETEFGREFDSLADVITFGVAPALLTYLWGIKDLPRRAWLFPLIYVVATAARLARFNVQTKVADSRYFAGLPTPAAAGALCSLLFFVPDAAWRDWMEALMAVALVVLAVLMVSTLRYFSLKKLDLRQRWSYRMALPLVAIVVVVVTLPQATFLVIAVSYALSAPVSYILSRLRRRPPAPAPHS